MKAPGTQSLGARACYREEGGRSFSPKRRSYNQRLILPDTAWLGFVALGFCPTRFGSASFALRGNNFLSEQPKLAGVTPFQVTMAYGVPKNLESFPLAIMILRFMTTTHSSTAT
jgi:hypothetical protein